MTAIKPASARLSRDDVRITAFEPSHLDGALRLSTEAVWPHRAEDWQLTLSVSRGVVALRDGKVVGTALCSAFGDVATMNMIIVDAQMRGRGLGRSLMEQVIAIGGARELRLTATADGLPLYEKMGFVACGEVCQQQGIAQAATPELSVRTGDAQDIPTLAALDLQASGMSRAGLLGAIAAQGEVLRCENGFALLRDFGRGRVLGPVVARDAASAAALMAEAARRCAGGFLRVDLPADAGMGETATRLGLQAAGGGIAMKRDARTRAPSEYKTFALVSQALG
ncbi:GNAT family N-acetyltransferase [Sulfitobacter sp. PR48]|uniref:GNAT family N-acetyltransferase n=1 Tax=Sulfitobacter sp. PR48 TaxID=3028383 RepID=UPI00237B0C2E|nr:GNAT family N-acetyltransferase [Sulfitobacter sp. PR48]MDD9720732.1 GNAT family N-acetyltransferase [Sulfitobacter sp. PR48]